jgi:N-acetylmuramoyl-L-alanine amidase
MTTPNHGGALRSPSLIVCHYSVSGDMAGTLAWLRNPKSKASYHILVDRDGEVENLVPTSTVAWHAGRSEWRGRGSVNSFSIGVCCINWGPLKRSPEGVYTPVAGTKVIDPDDVFHGLHTNGTSKYHYWQKFPEPQITALDSVNGELFEQFEGLREIVNHSDVAPLRKVDCGPALAPHLTELQKKFSRR